MGAFTYAPYWLLAASCCVAVGFVSGCGITTHTAISHRALRQWSSGYAPLVREELASLEAGSPYPDTYYDGLCMHGELHQVSEDVHWLPYTITAVEYMRDLYPPPLASHGVDARRLFSFLLGVASHQMADVVWHASLTSVPNGLIDADAFTDYFSDRQDAHSSVDTGGDVLIDYETVDTRAMYVTEWYTPYAHLQNIFEKYAQDWKSEIERNATVAVIKICTDIMWIGRQADAAFLEIEYNKLAANNSWFLESFYDYYLGGMHNMVAETVRYWDWIVEMYEHGTQACAYPNNNPFYMSCPSSSRRSLDSGRDSHNRNQSNRSAIDDAANGAGKGEALRAVGSNVSYADVGHVIIHQDVNGDGVGDVVIGVPNSLDHGCLSRGFAFVKFGSSSHGFEGLSDVVTVEDWADAALAPPPPPPPSPQPPPRSPTGSHCDANRFGWAMATVDLNKDGIPDLVVGAPSEGFAANVFTGAVYLYSVSTRGGRDLTPYLRISGVSAHDSAGFRVVGGDLDGDGFADLVISSPYAQLSDDAAQTGAVWIFLSSRMTFSSGGEQTLNDAHIVIRGSSLHGRFGYFTQIVEPRDGSSSFLSSALLLVGSPNALRPDAGAHVQGTGSIHGYFIDKTTTSGSLAPLFIIDGAQSLDALGHSFDVSYAPYPLMFASIPTHSLSDSSFVGGVFAFDLSALVSISVAAALKPCRFDATDPRIVFVSMVGDRQFGRLGYTVTASDDLQTLFLSAPLARPILVSSGRVYAVPYAQISAKHQSQPQSQPLVVGDSTFSHRTGSPLDHFGTHACLVNDGASSSLWIAASLGAINQDHAPHTGLIHVLPAPF
eukprot:ANDGO_01717.mRNA.1 Phosphatidylinositol-glycan-specific phospholipase D